MIIICNYNLLNIYSFSERYPTLSGNSQEDYMNITKSLRKLLVSSVILLIVIGFAGCDFIGNSSEFDVWETYGLRDEQEKYFSDMKGAMLDDRNPACSEKESKTVYPFLRIVCVLPHQAYLEAVGVEGSV
jgi:hypothetical protein